MIIIIIITIIIKGVWVKEVLKVSKGLFHHSRDIQFLLFCRFSFLFLPSVNVENITKIIPSLSNNAQIPK